MRKLKFNRTTWWKAESPAIARFFQIISSALATLPLYYASLPEEFKTAIPICYLKIVAISGGVCTFVLQFFNKKES
jgi:hypothetical protein